MEIERVQLDNRMILGIPSSGGDSEEALDSLWLRFFERMDELSAAAANADFYILREYVEGKRIDFFAGVEVENDREVPEGMEIRYLMEGDYLVYPHRGGKAGVTEAFRHIYEDLMGEKGYLPSEGYDFEVYTPHYYERDDADSIIYLCVPIVAGDDHSPSKDQEWTIRLEDVQDEIQALEDDEAQNKPAPPVFDRIVLEDDDLLPTEERL
ncbi:MAG: GyrI-like domain-containing protein [Tissierellia bacterium]|nr:GyrI-like domain-containing protein [Bacillota bacterium]NLL22433.1 GyrI-like domain-containing protein [Tissierellia bacterium]